MARRFQVRRGLLSGLLLTSGTGMLLAAASLFGLIASGAVGNRYEGSGPGTVTGFGSVLSAAAPAAPPPPAPPASSAPLARLIFPAVQIDAPIVVKGVGANGVMQSPDNAVDVAWYDFTARPGSRGNAVFAGHVDDANVGLAVFWPLKDLKPGDRIEVRLADGTSFLYAVTAVNTFDAASAPVGQIVGPATREPVTLITCAGQFNRQTRQYDKRLVVRAEGV